MQKNMIFFYDYNTYKKTNYNIHLETEKHKKMSIILNNNDLMQKMQNFICEC
jgi:hypothetical protein